MTDRDPFIWPYRDSSPVGPLGNGAKEMRDIERLIHARKQTEITRVSTVIVEMERYANPGIVTDTLLDLEECR